MLALKHFYRELGDKTWGWMGFYDAFNQTRSWYADSYLAIDQGPILLMIENHRSQLLWDLFMANQEIQTMMDAIGFRPDNTSVKAPGERPGENQSFSVFPNPAGDEFQLGFQTRETSSARVELYSVNGQKVRTLLSQEALPPGDHSYTVNGEGLVPGLYLAKMFLDRRETAAIKLIIN
jgi:hypothetical protein